MSLTITVEPVSADTLVLHLVGQLTVGESTTEFRQSLQQASASARRVILDFSGVSYVDSTGVGGLVIGYLDAQKQGVPIALAGLTVRMRDLLHMTKLSSLFTIYENVQEADRCLT